MLATMNRVAAITQSPFWLKNIAATADTPSTMKMPSIRFLIGRASAIVPRMGARIAMMTMPIVLANANRWVATAFGRFAPATVEKKMGKTAAMMVVTMAE